MVLILVLLALLGVAGPLAAQDTPIPPTAQHVVCDSGCGSPPASADGTSFVAGTTNVSLIGAAFNDALVALTTGTYAAPRITAYRALHINLRTAAGVEFGTATTPLSVSWPGVTGTLQNAATATGNGTSLSTVGMATVALTVTNSSATVVFYGTENGTDYGLLYGLSSNGAVQASTNANGTQTWLFGVSGYQAVRAQITTCSACTVTVTGHATPAAGAVQTYLSQSNLPALAAGTAIVGKVGIDQTTPGTTNAVQANAGTNLNTSLLALDSTVAGVQAAPSAAAPSKVEVVGGIDGANLTRQLLVTAQGVLYVQPLAPFAAMLPSALWPPCNAVRKLNCR